MKVLIADEYEVVRAGLRQMLRRYEVVEAETAEAALRLFRKHKPDVTILEVRLPGDGLDCLARIKRENPNAHVLMFSGHDNPTYIARAVALGAHGFLLKTATAEEIVAAVKTIAAGGDLWPQAMLKQVRGTVPVTKLERQFTHREGEVLKQLAFGLTNKDIGKALGISYETVKEHVQHILQKVGVPDRTQAAVWAVREGLV